MGESSDTSRVLCVDDRSRSPGAVAADVERAIDGLAAEAVTTASEGLQRLADRDVDCVVSGYDLPRSDGVSLLRSVREEYPDLPFVLYAEDAEESVANEALSAGVTDYLPRGADTTDHELLATRVRRAIETSPEKRPVSDPGGRHTTLFEELGEPVVEVRFDGDDAVVRAVNDAFEEVFGLDEDMILGETLNEHIVPEGNREDARELNRRAREGKIVERELRRRADDGWRWFLLRTVPFGDGTRAYAIYLDVTERKRQQERFESFIEHSTDVISVLDEEGHYRYNSPSSERVLGYSPEELRGENAFDYVHPEDRERTLETFQRAVENPELNPTVEFRFRQADGSYQWVESFGNNQLDNPAVEGFIVNSRDVTDRVERERRLQRQKARIEALHDVATDIETCESSEAIYERIVDAAEEILEFDIAIVDRVDGDVLVPAAVSSDLRAEDYYETTPLDAEDNFGARAFRAGEPSLVEDIYDHAVDPASTEFRSALTVPIGEYGVFQTVDRSPGAFDETDLELVEVLVSHAEKQLARLEDQRRLRERTDELRRQNDRLEQFASVVSHDLKNPLIAAEGRLELAKAEDDDEHLEELSAIIERSIELVEDLLTLAREGERVTDPEPVDLETVASDCWRTVATDEASLVIEADRTLRADPRRLKHILENLIANAVDHGGEGVAITIGDIDSESESGFYVADDGPGIPPEDRDRVFEVGHSTAQSGSGFGLNIVREAADAHDWDVRVTESESGGARFDVVGVEFV